VLPDLPSLKNDIQHVITRYLQNQTHARLGIFSEAPKHTAHEGNRMRTIRADGSIDDTEFKEISAEMIINIGEVPQLTIEDRKTKINNIADEMARQITKNLFASLNEALDKAGQTVNRQGKPLDAEAVFQVLEKIELDFDETGKL
jgi:hypothetical protein